MNTVSRLLVLTIAAVLFTSTALLADPSAFPSNGLDAQSLGRGGTVIACPPGVWSTFGNPATLTPEGYYILAVDYLDQKDTSKESWEISIVDTSSSIRGALSYITDPVLAGFSKKMWGVAFSQTLMPALYLGESFHLGDYEPTAPPGSTKSLNTIDAGLLFKAGPDLSLGYVIHNLIPSDRDLLEQYSGIGIGLRLPMRIYFAIDYEEDPDDTSEKNLRTGIEFHPIDRITGRLGYQDHEGDSTYLTLGITYTDTNGTLDAAILHNKDTDKMDTVIFGISIRM